MRILIVKLGALGDVINTFPLAVNIKQNTGSEIHWIVGPLSYPLVARHSCIDRAILFDRRDIRQLPAVVRELRKERYDLTLDLQRILKSGFFSLMAGSDRRIGFDRKRCKEMSWLFPFERIPPSDPEAHMVDQYLEFGNYLKIRPGPVRWKIPRSGGLKPELPFRYIVMNIGATKPANKWSPFSFGRLADLIEREFQLPCVMTGGHEDRPMADIINKNSAASVFDLTGKTSVFELSEVIVRAECVITCDTGPMHLASAVGTEVISLFGPSNPRRTGPYRGIVINGNLDCSPCNRKKCKDPLCMHAIKPSDVIEQLSLLLN